MRSNVVFKGNDIIHNDRIISCTVETFENLIRNYPYSGGGREKDEAVEKGQYPPFVVSFYNAYLSFERVPTQTEMSIQYEKDNNIELFPALQARLLRSYPSLLRDRHFYLMCIRDGLNAEFSIDSDMNGVDVKIRLKDVIYNVRLYFPSARSLQYASQKNFRHSEIKNKIDLPLKQIKTVGEFLLYNDTLCLKNEIFRNILKRNID